MKFVKVLNFSLRFVTIILFMKFEFNIKNMKKLPETK